MKEKTSVEIFDENYKFICDRINEAAIKSGRSFDDITLLAATKTVDISVINYAIQNGIINLEDTRNKILTLNLFFSISFLHL